MLAKVHSEIEKATVRVSKLLSRVGISVLVLMMLLTTADVFLRYFFNRPIPGAYELTEQMMGIMVAFLLAYAALQGRHVDVDVLLDRLPKRIQAFVASITAFLFLSIILLTTWQTILQLKVTFDQKLTTSVLLLPIFPFAGLLTLGLIVFALALVSGFLGTLLEVKRR